MNSPSLPAWSLRTRLLAGILLPILLCISWNTWVVYHEALEQSQLSTGFLFRERTQQLVKAELVRFNVRLFEQQFRAKVEKSLEAVALREIIELQI